MDKEEFTRAVLEYESTLYRVAKSMLGSEADCADAAQNALLRAWEKQHTLRDTAYFKTWLTRILINECRAMLRQRAKFSAQNWKERVTHDEQRFFSGYDRRI